MEKDTRVNTYNGINIHQFFTKVKHRKFSLQKLMLLPIISSMNIVSKIDTATK